VISKNFQWERLICPELGWKIEIHLAAIELAGEDLASLGLPNILLFENLIAV
jgi:hypothetical protein